MAEMRAQQAVTRHCCTAAGRRALADDALLIREAIKEQPDLTLAELCRRVAAASGNEPVSAMTMCNELHRLRLPRKKR